MVGCSMSYRHGYLGVLRVEVCRPEAVTWNMDEFVSDSAVLCCGVRSRRRGLVLPVSGSPAKTCLFVSWGP